MLFFRIILVFIAFWSTGCQTPTREERFSGQAVSDSLFIRLMSDLSEKGDDFPSDNLISNETSYLRVIDSLRQFGLAGGAYLGVGPEQNFTYIAHLRPSISFILDIRRDNLLLHLLYKAIFEQAKNRMEFLALLFEKKSPEKIPEITTLTAAEIFSRLEKASADPQAAFHQTLAIRLAQWGIRDSTDLATIFRFYRTFANEGSSIKYTLRDKPARYFYPTYKELAMETDEKGREASLMSNEALFQYVRSAQLQNRIIPVVGNFAGTHTLKAVGDFLRLRGDSVSAFYTSNVESYLFDDELFGRFAENAANLPGAPNSQIIRCYFKNALGRTHPATKPGSHSATLIESMIHFKEHFRGYDSYETLIFQDSLPQPRSFR